MEYLDFLLHIGPDDGCGHRLDARTPAGEASAFLALSWTAEEKARRASYETWRSPSFGEADLESLGGELFSALFPGAILALLAASLAKADEVGCGLRIRLELDPLDAQLRGLFALPWEALWCQRDNFLLLSRRTPLVRHPAVQKAAPTRPRVACLRILALMASPEGVPALDLDSEWKALAEVWRDHPSVEMTQLVNASIAGMRNALDAGEGYHVIHFMGHGGRQQEDWALMFCAEDGTSDPVSARRLAEELNDFRQDLRLIVLNACHSARVLPSDPAGVAMALVMAGLPAVVANQAPISDRAAIEFTKAFYPRLAAGDPLEKALAIARLHLRNLEGRGVKAAEWITPILFLRVPDGRLFDVSGPSRDISPQPAHWRPNLVGLAALLGACMGTAALLAAASLWFLEDEPIRYALGIGAAVLSGLGWCFKWFWSDFARKHLTGDLSWAVAKRRPLLASLAALPIVAAFLWLGPGVDKLTELRCGQPPPAAGVWRLALASFSSTGGPVIEKLWANEVSEELAGRLIRLPSLEIFPWKETVDPSCYAAVVDGSVSLDEDRPKIRALITPLGEASIELDEIGDATSGPSVDYLAAGLADKIIKVLKIELYEDDQNSLPTESPVARELNAQGFLSFLAGDYTDAEAKLRRSIEVDPKYASPHNNLGRLLTAIGGADLADALDHSRIASQLDPSNNTYSFNLALVLDELGNSEAAAPEYRSLLKRNVFHARARNNLGRLLLKSGELSAARRELKRAEADARDADTKASIAKNLSQLALAEGDPRQAGRYIERALDFRPDFPEALFYRTVVLEELSKIDAAVTRAEICRTYWEFSRVKPFVFPESWSAPASSRDRSQECGEAPPSEQPRPTIAVVTGMQGNARVLQPGSSAPRPAHRLQVLRASDVLKPGRGSQVELVCVDGQAQRVESETLVDLVCPRLANGSDRSRGIGVELRLGSWDIVGDARGGDRPAASPTVISPRCPESLAQKLNCATILTFPDLAWMAVEDADTYWLELTGPRAYPRVRVEANTGCRAEAPKTHQNCRFAWPWSLIPGVPHRLEIVAQMSSGQMVRSGRQEVKLVAPDDPRLVVLNREIQGFNESSRMLTRTILLLEMGFPNEVVTTVANAPKSTVTPELGLLLGEALLRLDQREQAEVAFQKVLFSAREGPTLEEARRGLDRSRGLSRRRGLAGADD